MYTDEGRRISDKLWEETLQELRFAGVEDVLQKAKHPNGNQSLKAFE